MASPLAEFYQGRSVLITGASGFIGKQLLEKLLRSCPDIGMIYVLLRPSKDTSAAQRIRVILKSTLFDRVRTEHDGIDLETKICVIAADLCQPQLGISESDCQKLIRDVSIVFHLAATVSFNEPLKVAVNLNILGLRRVMDLCKLMPKLEAFIHVSTAYANCDRSHITEKVYPPPLTPTQILDATEWMSDQVFDDITPRMIAPRPNTYTFTKAIAEQLLLDERDKLPAAIYRPSIVTASVHEPMPGWIDNLNGCTGVLTAIGSGLLKAMYGSPECTADLVPVDFVANSLIAIGWYTATHQDIDQVPVYHFTSGHLEEPLNWGYIGARVSELFHRHPLDSPAWIPKGYVTQNRLNSTYSIYVDVYLRMVGIDIMRRIIGKKPRMLRIHRSVRKMATLMEYFTSRQWSWTTENTDKVFAALSERDKQEFNMDVRTVHWPTYFENYCLGIRQHILHQDLSTLPDARKLLKWFHMLRRVAAMSAVFLAFRFFISRTETASRLWRFMVSMMTIVLERMPRALRA